MELKETNHSYYCSDSNYYVGNYNGENFGRCDYDTWADFKDAWFLSDGTIDHDYNHCFRYDLKQQRDEDDEAIAGEFSLHLYMILQRKGIFRPVIIQQVKKEDLPEIENYLKDCYRYLQHQWQEVAEKIS